MATKDWKFLIFEYDEIYSMKIKDRAQFLKKTIDDTIESQKERMKAWDEERRAELYESMIVQA